MRVAPAVLCTWLWACTPATTPEPPRHLVLITVDTLRADRIGAYGYARARTPNLDRLADESIRFDRAFSHASVTMPAIASLMTGQLPAVHRVFDNGGRMLETIPTLATVLEQAGFATGAFIGSFPLRDSRGFDRGFSHYTREFHALEAVRPQPENLAGQLTDDAIAWIDAQDPSARLFLWVHYQEPHGPYTPPDFEAPPANSHGLVLPMNVTSTGRGGIPRYQWLGHGRLDEYEARYDGEIAEVDRNLGRLLTALRDRKLLDESVVVFSADHGEAFGEENLYCSHGEGVDESLLRVPLLLRIPGQPAAVRTDVVGHSDVATTVMQVLGIDSDAPFPGRSLLRDEGDRTIVAQFGQKKRKRWRSIRRGDVELRDNGRSEPTLLSHGRPSAGAGPPPDPDGSAPQADLAENLEAELDRLAPWPVRAFTQLTEEDAENLKRLGYLD